MRRFLLTLFLAFLVLAAAAAWVGASLYTPYQGFPSGGVYVDIPHGASQRSIARILAEQGVVHSRYVFEGLTRARGRHTLEAGEYFFDHPVTPFQVYDDLSQGRVYVREFQVPEGYSMFDIADLVASEGFTTREDFLAAAADPTPIRDLAPHAPSLEGFLFPATYEFPRHLTGQEIAAAMVKRFREAWTGIVAQNAAQRNSSDPTNLSLQQTVTLASLVERETPKPDERPLVAGVFANRLHQGVPMQCDPTVVYAMELAGQYNGTLQSADLQFDSPYNTYRNRGLPPGPIANPGVASLLAALAPQQTDDLYFVANTEGGHFFSKTLAEHDHNINIYHQRLAEQQRAAAQSSGQSPRAPRAGATQ